MSIGNKERSNIAEEEDEEEEREQKKQKVIIKQPKPRRPQLNRCRKPAPTYCKYCKASVTTNIEMKKGVGVWLSFSVFFVFCLP